MAPLYTNSSWPVMGSALYFKNMVLAPVKIVPVSVSLYLVAPSAAFETPVTIGLTAASGVYVQADAHLNSLVSSLKTENSEAEA